MKPETSPSYARRILFSVVSRFAIFAEMREGGEAILMQEFWSEMNDFDFPASNRQELDEIGFTVLPGPVPADDLVQLVATYDAAVNDAFSDDVKVGSSTTRVRDFVNRGPAFDKLYLHPPVLKASCHIIGTPLRLSTMHARTLRQGLPAQDLHVDYERDSHGWTMVGFIFMIDEFRDNNGATRFVPGSHLWSDVPQALLGDRHRKADYPGKLWLAAPPVPWCCLTALFGMDTP